MTIQEEKAMAYDLLVISENVSSTKAIEALQIAHKTLRVADYTTRSNYQKNYAKVNRDAINARKRAWRKIVKQNACQASGEVV